MCAQQTHLHAYCRKHMQAETDNNYSIILNKKIIKQTNKRQHFIECSDNDPAVLCVEKN